MAVEERCGDSPMTDFSRSFSAFAIATAVQAAALVLLVVNATPAHAMIFDVEYTDNRPLFPPALWVSMSGEIETGDAARFVEAISPYLQREIYEVVMRIDSPGGRLLEGMRLGRAISALPYHTSISVGTEDGTQICASACVLAYLGADYRFLAEPARLGVHQFSINTELGSDEALSISQALSAEIVEYIREMRADPELFSLMVSAHADDIYWVPKARLEDLWVVTNGIYSETAEYRNIAGSIALYIEQVSQVGSNSMTLLCGEKGLVVIFDLNEPEDPYVTQFDLYIDGATYPLEDTMVISREASRLKTGHLLPSVVQRRLENAYEIGARASSPDAGVFFGFQEGVKDPKIAEMAKGCAAQLANASADSTQMTVVTDVDLTGGDLTSDGIRDVTFEACQQICIENRSCRAVSYVVERRWCWPKHSIESANRKLGVHSAYFK